MLIYIYYYSEIQSVSRIEDEDEDQISDEGSSLEDDQMFTSFDEEEVTLRLLGDMQSKGSQLPSANESQPKKSKKKKKRKSAQSHALIKQEQVDISGITI